MRVLNINSDLKKQFWLLVLAGAVGAVDLIVVFVFHSTVVNGGLLATNADPIVAFLFGANAIVGLTAYWHLKALYHQYPAGWTGRWQLNLAEIVATVFLIGATLLAFRIYDPSSVLGFGVPVALNFWGGFLIALLFTRRIGVEGGARRWLIALGWLDVAVIMMFCGLLLEGALIAIVLRITGF